jgi:hypothetical protein
MPWSEYNATLLWACHRAVHTPSSPAVAMTPVNGQAATVTVTPGTTADAYLHIYLCRLQQHDSADSTCISCTCPGARWQSDLLLACRQHDNIRSDLPYGVTGGPVQFSATLSHAATNLERRRSSQPDYLAGSSRNNLNTK